MTGAARLAGEAALRTGAGLVSIATRKEHAAVVNCGRPELMCHGTETGEDLKSLSARASVIAIGPGLGQDEWAQEMLAMAVARNLPLVADADALNLLARIDLPRQHWVLTPHPGEAARLLGESSQAASKDRFHTINRLVQKHDATVVLKGAGTLVQSKGGLPGVCGGGNPAMASGGMGDVLTGIIAGFIAQGLELSAAARLGVCLHRKAADMATRGVGERGLLASDLLPSIRRLVNPDYLRWNAFCLTNPPRSNWVLSWPSTVQPVASSICTVIWGQARPQWCGASCKPVGMRVRSRVRPIPW